MRGRVRGRWDLGLGTALVELSERDEHYERSGDAFEDGEHTEEEEEKEEEEGEKEEVEENVQESVHRCSRLFEPRRGNGVLGLRERRV